MARGWESKSVEEQVADFESKRKSKKKRALTPQEAKNERERDSLLLARTSVQNDLTRATDPRHREQLNRALAHLDAKLAKLDSPTNHATENGQNSER